MEKTFSQKVTMAIAVLSYGAAIGCAIGAAIYPVTGPYDVIQASLMATVVFFAGVGIVLHVIATTRLKGIITLNKPHADTD